MKNLTTIIKSGSLKQRTKLLSEYVARETFNREPLLTKHEFNILRDSFDEPEERRVWNKHLTFSENMTIAILNLQIKGLDIRENLGDFSFYVSIFNSTQDQEDSVNIVLNSLPMEERIKTAKKVAFKMIAEVDLEEGFIKVNNERTLKKLKTLSNVIKEKKDSFYTEIQTLREYLKNSGFENKTYIEIIEDLEDMLSGVNYLKFDKNPNFGHSSPLWREVTKDLILMDYSFKFSKESAEEFKENYLAI